MSCSPIEGPAASSASAALSPPMALPSTGAVTSPIMTLDQLRQQQQQQQNLQVASLPSGSAGFRHSDPISADCLLGASTTRCQQQDGRGHPGTVPPLKAVSQQAPHVTEQECGVHEICKTSLSPSPPATLQHSTGQNVDTAQSTSRIGEDGAAAHTTSSSAAAVPTIALASMPTDGVVAMRSGLPTARPTKGQLDAEGGVDAATTGLFTETLSDTGAAGPLNILSSKMAPTSSGAAAVGSTVLMATATWRTSLVTAGTDTTITAGDIGNSSPNSPLTPESVDSHPEASVNRTGDGNPPIRDGHQPYVGGLLTTTTTTTAAAAASVSPCISLPVLPSSHAAREVSGAPHSREGSAVLLLAAGASNKPSITTSEATATETSSSGQRRKKRRPPSLFASVPVTVMSRAVPTQLVLPLPVAHSLDSHPPTPPPAPAAAPAAVVHPSTFQETLRGSPVSGTNRCFLPGQLQRPFSLPPSTPSSSSAALISFVLPTSKDRGGDECGADGRRLSTSETGQDAQARAEASPSIQPSVYAPMHVTPPAVFLAASALPSEPDRALYPVGVQEHQTGSGGQGSLSGNDFVIGGTTASNAVHYSTAGVISPADVSPNWMLPRAVVTHHRLPQPGSPSLAVEGVAGTLASGATPTVSNTSLGGIANHYGAGNLSSGHAPSSISAPTTSLIASAVTTGTNRLQSLSAARSSVPGTGAGSGSTAAPGIISPLFLFGAAAAAPQTRRRIPPPMLARIRSPVGAASPSTTVNANDSSGDMVSPWVAAPCTTSGRRVNAATTTASAGTPSTRIALPYNSRSTTLMINDGTIGDGVGTTADRTVRGGGCNPPATPARSGPLGSSRHGGTNGSLVRISHDHRTLVAGIFRVSRDGCLTVRNMLLLNPTRIDAGSATGGAGVPGTCGSFMGGSTNVAGGGESHTLQLLHPQQSAMNSSHMSSSGGLAGRTQLLGLGGGGGGGADLGGGGGGVGVAGGPGPMTPVTTGSDCYSPQRCYGGGGGGGGPANVRTPRNTHGVGGGPSANANASFTLFSTSMDTPFSPITYSMDSQRLAPPSPLGGHCDKAGAAVGPPQLPSLLRAARDEAAVTLQFPAVSSTLQEQTQPPHQGLLPGIPCTTEVTTSPTQTLGGGTPSSGGAAAVQNQVTTPNSTTTTPTTTLGRPRSAGGNSLHRTQLRPLASCGGFSGAPGTTNLSSPSVLPVTGSSTANVLGAGALALTGMASSLLLPYVDIPTWRGGMATANDGSCLGSPAVHANPGGVRTTMTAAATATSTMCTPGAAQNIQSTPLPPNVVWLRDLDILSTPVGEGASATVFVAIHKPTGRRLAVKRVDLSPLCLGFSSPYLRSGAPSHGRVNQLQHIVVRELQVLHLTYRSPFMVKVYNAFFLAEVAALDIVMEFMHYGSLHHLADCLQKHARMVRESQPQRLRLPTADSRGNDAGGDGEGGVHRGRASKSNSRCGSVHVDDSPHVFPLHSEALNKPKLADVSARGAQVCGVGRVSTGGNERDRSSMTLGSTKLLNSRCTSSERAPPPAAPAPRQLGVIGTRPGCDVVGVVDDGGVLMSDPTSGVYKHVDDSDDGLLPDSYSVKSDLGVDDLESDDGSCLVEEPFGVAERLVAVVGEQLLRGVRDMHSRGYIHDDIKPGNVLVNEHGVVKLSDFGLSKRCDGSGTGMKSPTLTFIPPVSVAPTRSNTPLQSPSMTALQLTGVRGLRAPFIWNTQRGSANGLLNSEMIGTTPPEMASAGERLVLDHTTSSPLGQSDGMDVLAAESTSSEEDLGNWGAAERDKGRRSLSSSSSDCIQGCSGTDKYMSPERHRGEPHGKPADIWAVGVTLAEFAVGEYPYDFKDIIDEFDRVSRMEKPVDVLQFNKRRAVPLSPVFADFCRLATLPAASQRPTAQELLEHPFFRQWHRPFNLKDYLVTRVPVPSNRLKEDYLAKQRQDAQEGPQPAASPGEEIHSSRDANVRGCVSSSMREGSEHYRALWKRIGP
ncbi:hypothetical protein JKF63_06389 [Porcisia hertigi]|uniref:mitogen-activated protein kinase kinase n=1 Tax=Porcisia hertigi TaxID=2761500 RepID=A0A837AYA4_9TRYP|nr:hypothetical protein JKF63_06389 [Porcisia hertigi]